MATNVDDCVSMFRNITSCPSPTVFGVGHGKFLYIPTAPGSSNGRYPKIIKFLDIRRSMLL